MSRWEGSSRVVDCPNIWIITYHRVWGIVTLTYVGKEWSRATDDDFERVGREQGKKVCVGESVEEGEQRNAFAKSDKVNDWRNNKTKK